MASNSNESYCGVTGTIGDMNYKVKDCPFHLPKENMKFFSMMQKASQAGEVCTYGNSYCKPDKFANKKPVKFT